jgi:predicted 2-oxoglutarate/Fe(II)-dependent dioxygenase YbiX
MSSITTDLAQTLSTVLRPGGFCTAGTAELLAPGLSVEGVGPIALPLLPVQAEQLIAIAERAPYGRGEDTLTDTQVRRTWQIGPERIRIDGRHWAGTLKGIVERAAEGLGVPEPVEAELYKLLVYDEGSFFVRHRDTEKVPGMFATLIVVLPSLSAGGELVVRHGDGEVRLALHCDDASEAAFAAFYADCVHEVLPVTSGYRIALVYNLTRRGQPPEPAGHTSHEDAVAALLANWAGELRAADDDAPEKLVFPLEHAYTPAELGFQALKGADAGIAQVVVAAANRSDCDVHLALVSVEENGTAEYNGGWSNSRDDDDFEAGEVYERTVAASNWCRSDGEPSPLTEIPVVNEEFSPPDAFDDLAPDEQHFHEATGNEGASFERTYRRAALVLWPKERLLAVINQAGSKVTLPFLADLVERWTASGADRASPLWRQAHDLSAHMIVSWPPSRWHPSLDKARTDVGQMLELLTRLEDVPHLDLLLAEIAGGGINLGDSADIANGIRLLPPERAASLLERIVTGAAATSLAACAALLVHAASIGHDVVIGAAKALVDALPGGAAGNEPRVMSGFIVDLFTGLARIDTGLANRAAAHMLAAPGRYDFDRVLVPAMPDLLARLETANSAAVRQIRLMCIAHLEARVAQQLEAPRDWRRPDAVGCTCVHCAALSQFLADPDRGSWVLRAKESLRGHVESTIRTARCDVDSITERRGSPHSLICTKNQASYERRVTQRKSDLTNLARLKG